MKTFIAVGCLALAAAPASATNFALAVGPGTGSADFGNTVSAAGALADSFSFTVPAGTANSFVGSLALTSSLDVTLLQVFLDSTPFTRQSSGTLDLLTLDTTTISAGAHTLFVNGNWGTRGGSYAGTLNYVVTAVPEPATWALMIGGFGVVGGTMRRRKTTLMIAHA